jgi:hypothetical protein
VGPFEKRNPEEIPDLRDDAPEPDLVIHNHMPSDDEGEETPSEAWARMQEGQEDEGDPELRADIAAAHDRYRRRQRDRAHHTLGHTGIRDDTDEMNSPEGFEVSGEAEPYKRGEQSDARMARMTSDSPIRSLRDLNARNKQLHPRRMPSRDAANAKIGVPRTLAQINTWMKNFYAYRR